LADLIDQAGYTWCRAHVELRDFVLFSQVRAANWVPPGGGEQSVKLGNRFWLGRYGRQEGWLGLEDVTASLISTEDVDDLCKVGGDRGGWLVAGRVCVPKDLQQRAGCA
jgi:hypothetical protein